jgi:hypothetical protein
VWLGTPAVASAAAHLFVVEVYGEVFSSVQFVYVLCLFEVIHGIRPGAEVNQVHTDGEQAEAIIVGCCTVRCCAVSGFSVGGCVVVALPQSSALKIKMRIILRQNKMRMAAFQKKGAGTTCLRQNDTSGLFFFKSQACGLAGRAKHRAKMEFDLLIKALHFCRNSDIITL